MKKTIQSRHDVRSLRGDREKGARGAAGSHRGGRQPHGGHRVVTLSAPVDDAVLKSTVEAKDYKVTGIA